MKAAGSLALDPPVHCDASSYCANAARWPPPPSSCRTPACWAIRAHHLADPLNADTWPLRNYEAGK